MFTTVARKRRKRASTAVGEVHFKFVAICIAHKLLIYLQYNYNNHNADIANSKDTRCLSFSFRQKITASIMVAIVTNSIQRSAMIFFHFFSSKIKTSVKATIFSIMEMYIHKNISWYLYTDASAASRPFCPTRRKIHYWPLVQRRKELLSCHYAFAFHQSQ